MKNYHEIEEMIILQNKIIEEGLADLKFARSAASEDLRQKAVSKIKRAQNTLQILRDSLNEAEIVDEVEAISEVTPAEETPKTVDELMSERNSLIDSISRQPYAFDTYKKQQRIKEIEAEINKAYVQKLQEQVAQSTETLEDDMEEVRVFDRYDENTKTIYKKAVMLSKEEAADYRIAEEGIIKGMYEENEEKRAKYIANVLGHYPFIADLCPELQKYADIEAVREYLDRAKKAKKAKKVTEQVTEFEENHTDKPSLGRRVRNFATSTIIAFNVKRTKAFAKAKNKWEEVRKNVSETFRIKKLSFKKQMAVFGLITLGLTPAITGFAKNTNAPTVAKKVVESTQDNSKKEKESEVESKFINQVENISFEDFLNNLDEYDEKYNVTDLRDDIIPAVGYGLNVSKFSDETKQKLIDNGVINEDPIKVFMNIIDARDNINNEMTAYDKLIAAKQEVNEEEHFNNISSLAMNEETEKQINTLFESVKTMYTGSDEEAKEECYKFLEFMNVDEPRKLKKDYGFHYNDMSSEGKLGTFIYGDAVLEKLREYDFDQDVIENLQYQLDNIADFLKEMGIDCNEAMMIANKEDGMGYNIDKVYGIVVSKDGEIISYGSSGIRMYSGRISGGKTTTTQMGGSSEQIINGGGKSSSTTVTGGGNETVTNVTTGKSESTTTTPGGSDTVTNITGDGESSSTEVEEGKEETVENANPEDGKNEETVVEEGKDEEIIVDNDNSENTDSSETEEEDKENTSGDGENSSTEVEEGKDEIVEDANPEDGKNEEIIVEEDKDEEVVIDGDIEDAKKEEASKASTTTKTSTKAATKTETKSQTSTPKAEEKKETPKATPKQEAPKAEVKKQTSVSESKTEEKKAVEKSFKESQNEIQEEKVSENTDEKVKEK